MDIGERLEAVLSHPRLFRVFAAVTVVVYLLSAGAEARTKCPWWDEGSLARPAYNLAFNGFLGDPLTDSVRNFREPLPSGLGKYMYWMPPLYFLALAGWFKLLGFSLFVARSLSIVWGLVLLGSWYSIVKSLTAHRGVALLCTALIAADYSVLISCTNVRADAMSAALGCAGLALYLRLRGRNLSHAVFAGAGLAAASLLTHPLGLIWVLALAAVDSLAVA